MWGHAGQTAQVCWAGRWLSREGLARRPVAQWQEVAAVLSKAVALAVLCFKDNCQQLRTAAGGKGSCYFKLLVVKLKSDSSTWFDFQYYWLKLLQEHSVFICVYFPLFGPGSFKLYELTLSPEKIIYVSGPLKNCENFCPNPKPKFTLWYFLLNASATQTILKF